jgi:hypothetical protein
MEDPGFIPFGVKYQMADLWISVEKNEFRENIVEAAKKELVRLYKELESYIKHKPEFKDSLVPLPHDENSPAMIQSMYNASELAGLGPMATVAGCFAENMGEFLMENFGLQQVLVENGGDIYSVFTRSLKIAVHAGKNTLSGKVGIEIPPGDSPMGICTSSGLIGPSLNFGKADAVMIACKNTLLADAYATAFSNMVKIEDDVDRVIEEINKVDNVLSAIIIKDARVGVIGKYKLKIFDG